MKHFFEKIKNSKIPVLLLLNKVDMATQELLEDQVQYWQEMLPNGRITSYFRTFQFQY